MGITEAAAPVAAVRRAYDLYSRFYDWLVAPLELGPCLLGVEQAALEPGDRVLEVGCGPGAVLVRMAGKAGAVFGVDLSLGMLQRATRRLRSGGHAEVGLVEADGRALPFAAEAFDVLYCSYVLDLIPLAEIRPVLQEFWRALRPGGRLVLVSMSKPTVDTRTFWERLYRLLPASWVPYLLGGCRPVLLEEPARDVGFTQVTRQFVRQFMPSEIVTGRKPAP